MPKGRGTLAGLQRPTHPGSGPHDLRQAILAFNATQAQLKHFLNDRTQMLAAISHDLRAPLTRMRLRAEFIDDAQLQAKLFKDVDEMQAMVDAALGFSVMTHGWNRLPFSTWVSCC